MQAIIDRNRDAIAETCRRHGVARLEVFGSAARRGNSIQIAATLISLSPFEPASRNDLALFADLKESLETLLGRPVDLVDREAVAAGRNFIRRRAILKQARDRLWLSCPSGTRPSSSICCSRPGMRKVSLRGSTSPVFIASQLHQNATIRSLEVIGEAAGKVSQPTRAAHPDIPWREIIAMRHRLVHGYGDVRLDLVWIVLRERFGPLIAELERLVPQESGGGSMSVASE